MAIFMLCLEVGVVEEMEKRKDRKIKKKNKSELFFALISLGKWVDNLKNIEELILFLEMYTFTPNCTSSHAWNMGNSHVGYGFKHCFPSAVKFAYESSSKTNGHFSI